MTSPSPHSDSVSRSASGSDSGCTEAPNAGVRTATANGDAHVEVIPTGAALGAEIRGLDLREKLPGDTVLALLEAFHAHQVLIFRDQQLSDERLIEIGEWFGPMYVPPPGIPMLGNPDQGFVTSISNVGSQSVDTAAARPLPFHSDLQYMPVPLLGAMLYAIEVPDFPHPLVRTHPATGRKSLYMSMFITTLLGVDAAEHDALRVRLWQHVDQEHLYYRHEWRAGDLLIWDNRCTNHKRDPFDSNSRRIMHRVQIAGTRPF